MNKFIIGVPKELKNGENRVGLRPQDVSVLLKYSGGINVETNAGIGCGFTDQNYIDAGAKIIYDHDSLFENSTLIIKVKEPIGPELKFLNEDRTFFCYFHFASSDVLTKLRTDKTLPYEELQIRGGKLPLLFPMSEIAGKIAAQKGAELLANNGMLVGGSSTVAAAKVLILGAGTVGLNCCEVLIGMGADVCVLDISKKKIETLKIFGSLDKNISFEHNTPLSFAGYKVLTDQELIEQLKIADLVIGAVHSKGLPTDLIIQETHFDLLKEGSVLIDVSIDQGGCTVASKATSHQSPTYQHKNTTMYCVPNMPGLTAKTSTHALCNATISYIKELCINGNLSKYYK